MEYRSSMSSLNSFKQNNNIKIWGRKNGKKSPIYFSKNLKLAYYRIFKIQHHFTKTELNTVIKKVQTTLNTLTCQNSATSSFSRISLAAGRDCKKSMYMVNSDFCKTFNYSEFIVSLNLVNYIT